jgi:hypothetical protein
MEQIIDCDVDPEAICVANIPDTPQLTLTHS